MASTWSSGPIFFTWRELVAVVLERELAPAQLAGQLLRLLAVHGLLDLLDEARARRPCRGCGRPSARAGRPRTRPPSRPRPRTSPGSPVTAAAESAAPPRASPSSLVSTMPVMPTRRWNSSALLHRVLAGHGVGHVEDLAGLARCAFSCCELGHQLVVDVQAAGGVHDHERRGRPRAPPARAERRISRRLVEAVRVVHLQAGLRRPACGAARARRAGRRRWRRAAGWCPPLTSQRAELGRGGGLARALQPGHEDHRGQPRRRSRAAPARRRPAAPPSRRARRG